MPWVNRIDVPEAQDAETLLGKPCIAQLVTRTLGMLTAIGLDHQAKLNTAEIDDVRSDRHLPAKAVALDQPVAKRLPKPVLGIGHVGTQLAGEGRAHVPNLACRQLRWRSRRSVTPALASLDLPLQGGGEIQTEWTLL